MVRSNINIAGERDRVGVEKSYPFDSVKKRSSVILQHQGSFRRYYKGAAEKMLEMCTSAVDTDGRIKPLTAELRDHLSNAVSSMTRTGLRTIGFAYIDLTELKRDEEDNVIDPVEVDQCVFVGAVGIKDPLRPESRGAVRDCQKAGIIVRMVTGDHPDTARFISRECGILTSDDHLVMTGEEFRKMYDSNMTKELEDAVPRLRVLARSSPEDKKKLVTWLKDHGEVVAATGDGTNDAPALKTANVGIAMAIAGTDVAKSAAHILILDDNFRSIVESVKWGRSVYDNIRKFVQFQLTINLVALALSLVGAIVSSIRNGGTVDEKAGTPLKAIQLLWVNLIMDTFAALALGTEAPTRKLLLRRPYKKGSDLISPVMWRNMLSHTAFQLALLFTLLYAHDDIFNSWLGENTKENDTKHLTVIFNVFVWLQIFNEINSRKVDEAHNVWQGFFSNWLFPAIIIGTVGGQILMVEAFGSFASTTGLTWKLWVLSVICGLFSLPLGVIVRFIPVDFQSGEIDIPPSTFAGAQLDRPDDEVMFQLDEVRTEPPSAGRDVEMGALRSHASASENKYQA